MRRHPLVLAPISFLASAVFAVSPVRAEDAPTPPAADPAAPDKPAKKEFDDEKIFADWKLCKQRGEAHCRKRGEYWAARGVEGNNLLWLGAIWGRAQDQEKSVDALTKFLDYKAPPDDTANAKNRPFGWTTLIDQLFRAKLYAKVIEASAKFRDENSDAVVNVLAQYGWQIPGHAARFSGDEANAIEHFTKAAELKFVGGILDLVDVHLAAGRVDDAKAALAKHTAGLEKGGKETEWMKGVLDTIGSPAPALAEAKSVSTVDPPTAWDKANILYLWGMQTGDAHKILSSLETRRKSVDGVVALGVSTFKQYNPDTHKVEADLSEDKELELYRRLIEQTFARPLAPSVVVRQEWLDAAKLKWDHQFVIVDKDGKIRYARLNTLKEFDFLAVMAAAKHVAESAK